MPNNPSPSTTYKYLSPILEAYHKQSYDGMEHAIFPSYFHGKCQQNGVNPPGCPNPDCPVVCGTPGSLVHFYPVLRYLAFNQTRYLLGILSAPDSDAYKLVEQSIMDASQAHSRRMSRIFSRSVIKSASKTAPGPTSDFGSGSGSGVNPVSNSSPGHEVLVPLFVKKRSQDMKTELENIMKDIGGMLENACGGDANEDADGLPDCSWEQPMKEYILTFP
ncbi:hypothetical protein AcW1_009729 [Taiwanofungus camphoratus]|nr:hypothetical protein AcV5_002371 [Antrodia cinnamomea]KAI0948137.1 hypothetical protein AcW1_009729 [Antrodia cinnamomea]